MLTQERLLELFNQYKATGESAIDAAFSVGTYLYYHEIDIVNEQKPVAELVNCWRLCEWWGKHSPSLCQN
jgi:hypothetical protein